LLLAEVRLTIADLLVGSGGSICEPRVRRLLLMLVLRSVRELVKARDHFVLRGLGNSATALA
jgi:hypothetical protein